MAQFPGGTEITPAASMLGPSINNAAALYGQLQQLKIQREELDNKKLEARYDMGIKLVTDPKMPASVKVKAYNNAVRPYLEKLNPGAGIDLSENDFKGGDVQSLIDEITPIFNSDKFTKEEKMRLAAVPFSKFQSQFGLNKEAADTLMRGFGVSEDQNKEPGSIDAILARRVQSGEITLEDAIKLKAQSSPQSFQVIGAQGGVPIAINPKTLETRPVPLPGSGPLTATAQNESQANAALFGKRASDANSQIDKLAKSVDLAGTKTAIEGALPNVAKSSGVQRFEQAKRNFINAVLRRESGAVISPSEFEEGNKQYFPVFGDKPEVLEQKRKNRETAISGLQNASGAPVERPAKFKIISVEGK